MQIRQSAVAPERRMTTCACGGRFGLHDQTPLTSLASGGGSMPAPEPRTRASTSSSPAGVAAPILLPDDLLDRMRPGERDRARHEGRDRGAGERGRSSTDGRRGDPARLPDVKADEERRQSTKPTSSVSGIAATSKAAATAAQRRSHQAQGLQEIADGGHAPERHGERRLDHDVDHREPVAGAFEPGTGCSIRVGS